MTLTLARLRGLLEYDPETGVFTAKTSRGGRPEGAVLGSLTDRGYLTIRLEGKLYYAHRLAWFYMTGEMPKTGTDHRNLIKSDNRWSNLRQASKSQNAANSAPLKVGRLKGVYWHKGAQRWAAGIRQNYQRQHLGLFDTPEAAHAAYAAKACELFGEFARAA